MDIIGLLMHGMIFFAFLSAVGVPSLLVLSNMDPAYYVCLQLMPEQTLYQSFVLQIFRLAFFQWTVLEGVRSITAMFLPAVSIFNIVIFCLKHISGMHPNNDVTERYRHLLCLVQFGRESIRYTAGVAMGCGFVVAVLGTWIVVIGWKMFPLFVYLVLCTITLATYIGIWQTVPRICFCFTFSQYVLQKKWPKEILGFWKGDRQLEGLSEHLHCKYWMMKLKALRPISWYYYTAVFDQDTTQNFYENIFLRAVDLILII